MTNSVPLPVDFWPAMTRGFAPPNPVVSRCLVGAVLLLIACAHAGLWLLDRKEASAASVQSPVASFSYTRLGGSHAGDPVSAAQIRFDLTVIAPHAGAVRMYSSTGGLELFPAIANELGLKVPLRFGSGKGQDGRLDWVVGAGIALGRGRP